MPQEDGNYKPVFIEGAIAIKTEGSSSYVYQAYLPAPASVPFYIKPSMGVRLQLTLPIMQSTSTGMLEAQLVRVTIEVPLRLAGGLGWEFVLSVGIYGEGKAAIEGVITDVTACRAICRPNSVRRRRFLLQCRCDHRRDQALVFPRWAAGHSFGLSVHTRNAEERRLEDTVPGLSERTAPQHTGAVGSGRRKYHGRGHAAGGRKPGGHFGCPTWRQHL